MKWVIVALVLVVAGLGTAYLSTRPSGTEAMNETTQSPHRAVAPKVAQELLQNRSEIQVLDVRTADEVSGGTLPSAKNIDFYSSTFAAQLDALPKDVPYMLLCRSGNRSGQTATLMKNMGFTEVIDIQGGVLAWQSAGLPLIQN